MIKKDKDCNWERLIDSVLFSHNDLVQQVSLGVQDFYRLFFIREGISNTGLHRKERIDASGTKNFIK